MPMFSGKEFAAPKARGDEAEEFEFECSWWCDKPVRAVAGAGAGATVSGPTSPGGGVRSSFEVKRLLLDRIRWRRGAGECGGAGPLSLGGCDVDRGGCEVCDEVALTSGTGVAEQGKNSAQRICLGRGES